jgi:hypothetical protein
MFDGETEIKLSVQDVEKIEPPFLDMIKGVMRFSHLVYTFLEKVQILFSLIKN